MVLRHMRHMNRNGRELFITAVCIFLFMFLLESLAFRFMGDDYIYSFMWEGHSMYVPLSENARRIDGFGDILASGYSYYMTWGGRVIAQMLAMFFLWIGRPWFNLVMAAGILLLLFSIQWIAHEGRITFSLRPFDILITFLCFWSFNINFSGTIVWIDGACNYFFPLVALILFLLPYIHQYFMEGESRKSNHFIPLMFILGVLAGDSNENTICWIGLSGLLYLDLIIHQERIQDGSRKITYITEVQKMEGDVIVLQDLFRYKQTGFDENGKALGQFMPTGLQPQFLSKFKAHNVEFPKFMQQAVGGQWEDGD